MAFLQPWTIARQITTPERNQFRARGLWSELYLPIQPATFVAECMLDIASLPVDFTNNQVVEIPITAFTWVAPYDEDDRRGALAGMSVWVGSIAHDWDVGECRLRVSFDDAGGVATLSLGECSDIRWLTAGEDARYITIIDIFPLWSISPRIIADEFGDPLTYMDWDVEYIAQHENRRPQVNMGAHAVVWLDAAGEAEVGFSAAKSWIPGSRSDNPDDIDAWAWTMVQPAAAGDPLDPTYGEIDAPTAESITLTLRAPGWYRVMCVVSGESAGEPVTSEIGVRYVCVLSEAAPPFTLFSIDSIEGSRDAGGWTTRLRVHGDFSEAAIRMRSRALAILCARDYITGDYVGGVESTIGQLAGRENIVLCGYLDNERVVFDPEQSTTEFILQSLHGWAAKVAAEPWGLDSLLGDEQPDSWLEFHELTVLKALWQLYQYRSSLGMICDCFAIDQRGIILQDDDTEQQGYYDGLSSAEGGRGVLWSQIKSFAQGTVIAMPCFNRYGQLHVEIDAQIEPVAYRDTVLTIVQNITSEDWAEQIALEHVRMPTTCQVELGGVGASRDEFGAEIWEGFARAYPEGISGRFGDVDQRDGMCLHWDYANRVGFGTGDPWLYMPELGNLIFAWDNNPFPSIPVRLLGFNRILDIAPRMLATIDVDDIATSGLVWEGAGLIVRRMSYDIDAESGAVIATVNFEGLTDDTMAFSGKVPKRPTAPDGTPPPAFVEV